MIRIFAKESASGVGGKDLGGSQHQRPMIRAAELAAKKAQQVGTIKDNNGAGFNEHNIRARSRGSRFLELDDIEDHDGLDMETDVSMEGIFSGDNNGLNDEVVLPASKEKSDKGTFNASGSGEGFVLVSSHPGLVEGAKRVDNGPEGSANLRGKGGLRRMKDWV